jgi:hypothetical protein
MESSLESCLNADVATGWSSYQPNTAWYLHNPFGIHGIGHAARVLVWANLIGYWMLAKGRSLDLEVVRWAAVLHDVRRLNDASDHSHGTRCSKWLENGNSALQTLCEEQKRKVAYCADWHVPPDREAPAMIPELVCLKDADALDRVRLGGLNVGLLRTDCAKAIVGQAQFLCDYSEIQPVFRNQPWNAVRPAGVRMGLWSTSRAWNDEWLHRRLRFLSC